MLGYKLMRKRNDGTFGSLFINRSQKFKAGKTYPAEDHRTKGFAHRPGWHILGAMSAPHLSKKNRVWVVVKFPIHKAQIVSRPASQGSTWFLASSMKIIGEV